MFGKTNVEILGLIQNMSLFQCPHCQGQTHLHGSTHRVEELCRERNIDLLADIPFDPRIGEDADAGKPTVMAEPESERASIFLNAARKIASKIALPSA